MKFEKIIIPPGWQESFTKYPNGRTIFEALSATITTVNEGIEEVNQKVDQGLIAIDQAENTIRQEITESFDTLQLQLESEIDELSNDLIADFGLLQSQVLTLIAGKADKTYVDAQLAEKVQNFKLKNGIVNGNFANGLTDWSGGEIIEGDIVKAGYRLFHNTGVSLGLNKVYLRAKVRVRSLPTPGNLTMGFTGSLIAQQTLPVINQWYNISFIHIANKTSSVMQIAMTTSDALIDVDKNFGVLMVDLTTTFGAGNEPTKIEMDELMKVIPNQWWDGELTLTQKQYMTWLLNLQRKNTNAIIALGGTII